MDKSFYLAAPTVLQPYFHRFLLLRGSEGSRLTASGDIHGRKHNYTIDRNGEIYTFTGPYAGDHNLKGIIGRPSLNPTKIGTEEFDSERIYANSIKGMKGGVHLYHGLWQNKRVIINAGEFDHTKFRLNLVFDPSPATNRVYGKVHGHFAEMLQCNLVFTIKKMPFTMFELKGKVINRKQGKDCDVSIEAIVLEATQATSQNLEIPLVVDWSAKYPLIDENWNLSNQPAVHEHITFKRSGEIGSGDSISDFHLPQGADEDTDPKLKSITPRPPTRRNLAKLNSE